MKVLYSPLDWGIGHASRSIWYIHRLLEEGHEVVLAADGAALALLRTVFPALSFERCLSAVSVTPVFCRRCGRSFSLCLV